MEWPASYRQGLDVVEATLRAIAPVRASETVDGMSQSDSGASSAPANSAAAETFLAQIYTEYSSPIHTYAFRLLGNQEDADDVTQDVFIRAWQKLSTFRGEAAFGTWLHRLAVNVILARRTSLGVERRRFDDSAAALEMAPSRPHAPDAAMDFDDAVSRLPDGARQVFVLHDVEGYKHDEIADMLGIVAGTSKSQLHHARMALRRHLDR